MDINKVKSEIKGPASLIMLPFDDNLNLDLEGLKNNLQYTLDEGMSTGRGFWIVPRGTGEYLNITPEEHKSIVESAVEIGKGKITIVAGCAGINPNDVIDLVNQSEEAGAEYVMVPPPFYEALDEEAMCEWYRIIAESTNLGLVIYDQSWRVGLGTNLTLPVIDKLSNIDNVVSLKYGSPNIFNDTIVALEEFAPRFAFIDNSLGYLASVSHMHGATGWISGPSSWWPEFELGILDLLEDGKYKEADKEHARITPYMAKFHGEFWKASKYWHNAAIIKASLEYVGLTGGPVRPPFRELNKEEKNELFNIMSDMDVKKKN